MTIYCPKCGAENEDSRWMCLNCGENLRARKGTSHESGVPGSNASESGRTGNSVPTQGQSGSFTPAASRVPGPSKPAPTYQPQPTRPSLSSTPSHNALAPKYGVLRGIASFCSIVAGAALVIGGLGFFVGMIMLALDNLRLIGFLLMVGSVLFAVTGYIIFKIYAEGIYVLLDIEMNTRQTAVYSRQIAKTPKQ